MKRYLASILLALFTIPLTSWGPEGHSTVAKVAENHLNQHAKSAVSAILGYADMAAVSSWAHDTREREPKTADWHFLNLQLGLTHEQFIAKTKGQSIENIYNQLNRIEVELASPATPRITKWCDLQFIIHFVGDAHQPMHVSLKEDKGGNLDTVKYKSKMTNLHSVRDGQLIRDDKPNYKLFAAKIDHAIPSQINQWQSDDLVEWLYESYQISCKLYAEAPNHKVLPSDYYTTHIGIVEDRLDKAGIRLAGVLNKIFP